MNKRIYEYDIVRTIATISVIIIHISAIAIMSYGQYSIHSMATIFVNRLLMFVIPVFIFLAGSLICESYKHRTFQYKSFLKNRGKKIFLPYIIISLMYYSILIYSNDGAFSIVDFLKQVITGSSQYHLYFIPIILQLYLLTPLFYILKGKVNIRILMPILILVSYASTIILKFQYSDRIFLKFIVPYAIGLYFGSHVMVYLKRLSNKKALLLFITTIGIGVLYSYEFLKYFYNAYSSELLRDTYWFTYCILSCFTLTWIAMQLSNNKIIQRRGSQFSGIAYYVYLIHPLLIAVSIKILDKIGLISTSLRLIFNLFFVGVLSIAISYFINRVITLKIYRDFKSLTGIKKTVLILVLVIALSSSYLLAVNVGFEGVGSFLLKSRLDLKNTEYINYNYENYNDIYTNGRYGYNYYYDGLNIDTSNESIKTSFLNDSVSVDIYYENFKGTVHSSRSFTVYGNRNIVTTDYIQVHEDKYVNAGGKDVHIINWSRKPLKYIENDFEHYASMDIIKNDHEVYNITIKSSKSIDPKEYLARFEMIDIDEDAKLNKMKFKRIENSSWNEETREFFKERFVENESLDWGFFEPSSVHGLKTLNEIEEKVQYEFMYILQYYDLNFSGDNENIKAIYDSGKTVEYTLQTSIYGEYDPNVVLKVLNGEYDDGIDNIIERVILADKPVLFRLNNEMNGDWCTYNAFFYQKDASIYNELWRYIYNRFEEKGADNVIWVWNPNESGFPDFKWNHYTNYFPGEEYVDIIGVTGYNTGDFYKGETWRSFESIYDEFMPEYQEVFDDYPFMITEFGSNIHGGDKAKWTEEMFETIDKYGFKAAIYWNSIDYTPEKEKARVYKFDDDEEIVEIFRKNLNDK